MKLTSWPVGYFGFVRIRFFAFNIITLECSCMFKLTLNYSQNRVCADLLTIFKKNYHLLLVNVESKLGVVKLH